MPLRLELFHLRRFVIPLLAGFVHVAAHAADFFDFKATPLKAPDCVTGPALPLFSEK